MKQALLVILSSFLLIFTTSFSGYATTITEDTPNGAYLRDIGVLDAWNFDGDYGFKGAGVKVAIIDTGIQASHNDLKTENIHTFDCTAGTIEERCVDMNGADTDEDGHGTHVAGIIAAQHNDIGVYGVAPEVEIYSYKVKTNSSIKGIPSFISALREIQTFNFMKDWEDKIRIVNLSIAFTPEVEHPDNDPAWLPIMNDLLESLKNEGVLIIAAAGNQGSHVVGENYHPAAKFSYKYGHMYIYEEWLPTLKSSNNQINYPAINPNVMAVAAHNMHFYRSKFIESYVNPNDGNLYYTSYNKSPYSQTGPELEISALGHDVFSTFPIELDINDGFVDGYAKETGTSQATPFVTGVAALLMEQYPEKKGQEIRQLIIESANPKYGYLSDGTASNVFNHEYGYGTLSLKQQYPEPMYYHSYIYTILLDRNYVMYPSETGEKKDEIATQNAIVKSTNIWNEWVQNGSNKWFKPEFGEKGASFIVLKTSSLYLPDDYGWMEKVGEITGPTVSTAYELKGNSISGKYLIDTPDGQRWIDAKNGVLGETEIIDEYIQTYTYEDVYQLPDVTTTYLDRIPPQLVHATGRIKDRFNIYWYKIDLPSSETGAGWIQGDEHGLFTPKDTPGLEIELMETHKLYQYPDHGTTRIGEITPQTVQVDQYWTDGYYKWYKIQSHAGPAWIQGWYTE
ncbi:S8 family serine peptidase [Bacillus sp. RO1]|uniref:S8 family peptidase n=1 Tax=Bacillus sp. RO1 TaxID=2722703 RepID=UPI001456C80F|nr:S8 family serine peptidase [Bacillus sp. RO1]NLP50242.1 S8 family serine peptidase [Bacillus sp. RO1]